MKRKYEIITDVVDDNVVKKIKVDRKRKREDVDDDGRTVLKKKFNDCTFSRRDLLLYL